MKNGSFIITQKGIESKIFYLLIFFSCVPYLGYGITLINFGVEVVGSLNQNIVLMGGIGKYISFAKDILTILLLLIMFTRMSRKNSVILMSFGGMICYGAILLMLNGRDVLAFTIAGIRTFMFVLTVILFCKKYYIELHQAKFKIIIFKILFLTLCINTILVLLQAVSSGSLYRMGSGAYRFSGAFPGSGNLGCYTVAVLLFVIVVSEEKIINKILSLFTSLMCVFLSIASGTRTCMVLTVVIFIYSMIHMYGSKLHFNWKVLLFLTIMLGVVFGTTAIKYLTEYIGRGDLLLSGNGRIEIFLKSFNSSNPLELMLGRGIGVGTNVSITMNLPNTYVSDSTYNLIFNQFGIMGLMVVSIILMYCLYILFKRCRGNTMAAICFMISVLSMYIVGNLFEHVAMSIIFILVYYMIYVDETILTMEKRI